VTVEVEREVMVDPKVAVEVVVEIEAMDVLSRLEIDLIRVREDGPGPGPDRPCPWPDISRSESRPYVFM
jgi:hypothetical protein